MLQFSVFIHTVYVCSGSKVIKSTERRVQHSSVGQFLSLVFVFHFSHYVFKSCFCWDKHTIRTCTFDCSIRVITVLEYVLYILKKIPGIYFFLSILNLGFKWVGPLIETRHLFWKGWSSPGYYLIQHVFQLLSVCNCIMWLLLRHPPKPAAKLSMLLHVHCCYIGTNGTPCYKNELATIYQYRNWCLLLRRNLKSLQQQGDEINE